MAYAAGSYNRILKILEKWPVDTNKLGGRDYREFLIKHVTQSYKDNSFEANYKYWDQQYLALQKIVDNVNKNKYKRVLSSSATNLTAEQCNQILSNDFLEELRKEEEKSFFGKLISLKPSKSTFRLCNANHLSTMNTPHIPVMANEVLEYLKPTKNEVIIDMTFGSGGHARKILASEPTVKILAVDRDPLAYSFAHKLQEEYPDQVVPLLGKFSDLPQLLKRNGYGKNSVDSVLFDFGCSSMQFDLPERGFSVNKNGPLDMRMDGDRDPDIPTAADVLSNATEEDIYKIIKYYGEEKQARKIARAVVEARYLFKKLTTTEELADLVESVIESSSDKKKPRHAATKTFQALRIFVNNELNEINYGMLLAHHYLKLGGRMVTITFHSLEDIIVKRHILGNLVENAANPLPLKFSSYNYNLDIEDVHKVMEKKWKMLHKHVLVPSFEEVESNNRSRSAKLRAAIKIR